MEHELKTDSGVFNEVIKGNKTFEIRLNNRGFMVGDVLLLKETVHSGQEMQTGAPLIYTGEVISVIVTYILYGPIYGLAKDWVIMSIEKR